MINMPKYENYQEAFERETIKNLDLKNKELEKRMKLEESLNILATFSIIAIVISIIVVGMVIFGIVNIN